MKRSGVLLAALAAASVALAAPAVTRAEGPSSDPEPVPSIDPDWSANFVAPATPRLRAATICRPVDAVFYAPTDWLRLAQKLCANTSPCANYYIPIAPPAGGQKGLPL